MAPGVVDQPVFLQFDSLFLGGWTRIIIRGLAGGQLMQQEPLAQLATLTHACDLFVPL